jgi:hypothetical protein
MRGLGLTQFQRYLIFWWRQADGKIWSMTVVLKGARR